jgi:hypothetical protein
MRFLLSMLGSLTLSGLIPMRARDHTFPCASRFVRTDHLPNPNHWIYQRACREKARTIFGDKAQPKVRDRTDLDGQLYLAHLPFRPQIIVLVVRSPPENCGARKDIYIYMLVQHCPAGDRGSAGDYSRVEIRRQRPFLRRHVVHLHLHQHKNIIFTVTGTR